MLTFVPLVLLTTLTYVSGRVIQRDERAGPTTERSDEHSEAADA